MAASVKLSIVATLYQSASYVQAFCARAAASARQYAGEDFEIVLVDDGSPDDSLTLACAEARDDTHVRVVELSRNFGHHKAMMTGLAHARGELVFLIDSDLEEEPEWLQSFAERLTEGNFDMVYGVQPRRRGGWFERLSGALFYRLFRALTGVAQPDNIVTARLMRRIYVDALLRHQEREMIIGGLWITTGFRQASMTVDKHDTSPTTYTFRRRMAHLVNAITSFSSLPLVYTFYTGVLISAGALAYIAYLVYRYAFVAQPPSGYTSILASIWLFSGLIIFFMGVLGLYLSKIFIEVKQRPYTIVRAVHGGPDTPNPNQHP